MDINRVWSMPNKNTFSMKPVRELLEKYITKDKVWLDPFANSNKFASITNDLNPEFDTDYHLDALEFLKTFKDNSVDGGVLFDPPYSPRQASECYKSFDITVNMQTTQASFWSNMKKEISRICAEDAVVISFSWNSGGVGKKYGFKQTEILLVPHGGWHNDTICVVEHKIKIQKTLFKK